METLREFFLNHWILLAAIVAVGGFLLSFIAPWLLLWRYKSNQRWLQENGRPTLAKILKIWDSGTTIGYSSQSNMVGVGLLLEVTPEGREPYQVKARDQLHVIDFSRIAPGMFIEVCVHPEKPNKVVVSKWNAVW